MMDATLQSRLDAVRAAGCFRAVATAPRADGRWCAPDGRVWLNFSSNDYLNLSSHPAVIQAAHEALDRYGAGAPSARLMSGNLPEHDALEAALATYCGTEAALVFGSGFLTNAGVVSALVRDAAADCVFADRLVHASLIDGMRLAGTPFHRFRHNDAEHLDALLTAHPSKGVRLVVVETVYSMDGDCAPLAEIVAVARRHGALILADHAHGLGVFPVPTGVDILVGTLGKALGSYGGFCACSVAMRDYFVNFARSFIFSTALPPASAAAARAALGVVVATPRLGETLLANAAWFAAQIGVASGSQIVPVMIRDNVRTLAVARALMEDGIRVTAIRPPTVPAGTARLRMSVTLAHTRDDLARAACAIGERMKDGHE